MRAYTVYTCTDVAGAVLYIGYTATYRQRMYQHCHQSRWFAQVHRVERVAFPTMAAALDHEKTMIGQCLPPHNAKLMPRDHRAPDGAWELPRTLIARIEVEARTHRITKSQALLNLLDRGLQTPGSETDEEVA